MREENHDEKLARLYRLYQAPMQRLALRILGGEHDAEDAVQDAFESISRNLERMGEPGTAKERSYISRGRRTAIGGERNSRATILV